MKPSGFPMAHKQTATRQLLRGARHGFSNPFVLHVPDQQAPIYCEKVVRLVPGKRLVAFGQWGEKPIVAKIFFNAQAKREMQRETKGARALLSANIPTPDILFQGVTQDEAVFLLVFERILNAQNLDEFWQAHKNAPESECILRNLTIELATQHVLGVIQEDLHLKNFLLTPEKIYTLDGANIRNFKSPLSKKESLENLALFFSQLGIYTNKLQQRLLHSYIKARGWLVQKNDLQLLQNAIRQWSVKRWLSYRKKIFRTSSQFALIKNVRHHLVYDRHYLSPDFEKFLHDPDSFFTRADTEILKAGRTSTVAKVILGNRSVVVKRYNIKNVVHCLKRCLRPTRALLSWYLSHQLQFVGIATAKPAAFIESRFFSLRGKSYFVMEHIEGRRADHFFEDHNISQEIKMIAAKKIIALFFNLARLRLSHGDLKITNILFNAEQEPVLIDLDSMREHQSVSTLWHHFRKDIDRFLENWQDNPAMQVFFKRLIEEMAN